MNSENLCTIAKVKPRHRIKGKTVFAFRRDQISGGKLSNRFIGALPRENLPRGWPQLCIICLSFQPRVQLWNGRKGHELVEIRQIKRQFSDHLFDE